MKLSKEIKTGIIVIGGILLFIMGFRFLKASPLFDDSKTLYAVYENIAGLQLGTPVTINGLTVGKVKEIRFRDTSGKLVVSFSVNNSLEFSSHSKAVLYDTGIIGGKGIQIMPVFDGSSPVQNLDTLETVTRPGLTELLQQKLTPLQLKVEDAVTNVDSLLVNINDVLDSGTKLQLRESIRGLNLMVRAFRKSANSINDMVEDNREQFKGSIENVNTITSNFTKLSDSLANAGLGKTMANLQTTVESLDAVLKKVENGEGSLGKLANNEELYNNLTNASRELDLLLQDFRLNPKRYVNVSVFGKKQKDYTVPEEDPAENLKN